MWRRRRSGYGNDSPSTKAAYVGLYVTDGLGFPAIHIFRENLTSELYCKILEQHMLPAVQRTLNRGWIFLDDNDPKHTSFSTSKWKEEHKMYGRSLSNVYIDVAPKTFKN